MKDLTTHPEINHFYEDVSGLKKGGKRRKRGSRVSVSQNVHVHVGNVKKSLSERITKTKRMMTTPSIFANAPDVQRPSHFAVGAGVGQWFSHEHPQGTARPASHVAQHQMVEQHTNPKGIQSGVVPSKYRITLSRNLKQAGGVMTSNDAMIGREPVPLPKEAYLKQSTKDTAFDGLQPHVSQNYFAPTGAPGNHPAPRASVAFPRPSGFEPLEANQGLSREKAILRTSFVGSTRGALPRFPPRSMDRPVDGDKLRHAMEAGAHTQAPGLTEHDQRIANEKASRAYEAMLKRGGRVMSVF